MPAIADFAGRYLKAEQSDGSLAPLRPACELHRWLVDRLDHFHERRGRRLCVLAPRGSAKTTWTTFVLPIHTALHRREPYILLTAETGDQARSYLEAIRRELDGNLELARDYPHVCGVGPVWRGDRLRLKNGVELAAIGTGGRIRGKKAGASRPSLIIVDDPQNKEHVLSELMRQRSWDWLTKELLPAGSPRTNVLVLGTALHRDGIVCRLQRTAGWESRVFKAIVQWPKRMDLWNRWQDILQDYDDPKREANALAFYQRNERKMNQ